MLARSCAKNHDDARMDPAHRSQPAASAACCRKPSSNTAPLPGLTLSSSRARSFHSPHHRGGASSCSRRPLHCMHLTSSVMHNSAIAARARRSCSRTRRWYAYADMALRSSCRGRLWSPVDSVACAARRASSSSSKRLAIAYTRRGEILRKVGSTRRLRSPSVAAVRSNFRAASSAGTSSSSVSMTGSGTGYMYVSKVSRTSAVSVKGMTGIVVSSLSCVGWGRDNMASKKGEAVDRTAR
ncbi:hypothetical protein GSI_01183 [Ganoderma sinense ZZ0214-1]|uniref:Uncharacterized protein n=1 Tax=Ganoderma sinense ZZ0214-1 TaxID=1077348 RepID=A0A2G8SUN5_9APHY|nr:hypothetical protein GSI_01183 [Ganoderma sinense ZZ0214-1]